jgi:hypothetical protein
VLENDAKENLLFLKSIDGGATSLEVFNVIKHFIGQNEIIWGHCAGLYTDGAQSTFGRNGGLSYW